MRHGVLGALKLETVRAGARGLELESWTDGRWPGFVPGCPVCRGSLLACPAAFDRYRFHFSEDISGQPSGRAVALSLFHLCCSHHEKTFNFVFQVVKSNPE